MPLDMDDAPILPGCCRYWTSAILHGLLGNVYLKPYTTNFGGNWKRDNKKRFSTLMVYVDGTLNTSPISFARWYDTDGILYSIPVNSQK